MFEDKDLGIILRSRKESPPIPFHEAVENEDIELVKKFIFQGQDIEIRDEYGRTALHIVVRNRSDMLNFLLDQGASIEAADNHGYTLILLAASLDQKNTVKLLLARGANINARDNLNQSLDDIAGKKVAAYLESEGLLPLPLTNGPRP